MNAFIYLATLSVLLTTLLDYGSCAEGWSAITDDTLEMALKDKRYLTRQLKCALGEGPCDPIGRKLKTYAPLVLRKNCPKCTPQEERQIQQVLSHIQRHYPKEWSKILQQYAGH